MSKTSSNPLASAPGASISKPAAVIFDMDGTLCNVASIRHLIKGGPVNDYRKDFDAFHREAIDCPPITWVQSRACFYGNTLGMPVLIVTARSARYRNSTAFWLAMHRIPSDAMWMRADGDYRPDVEVKREILAKIRKSFNPVHAYDDNPSIVALWRSEGIPCTVVPGWDDLH